MKRFVKFMAALMLLTSVIPAAAAPVKGDSNETGSITIHKYAIGEQEQLDDYELMADGEEKNADTVVIDNNGVSDVTLADLDKLSGVSFRITLVEDNPEDAETTVPVLKSGTADPGNPLDSDYEYRHIGVTDDNGIIIFNEAGAVDTKSGTNLCDLPQGTYLVEELGADYIEETSLVQKFIVTVPMTNLSSGEDWIYDVHVYPKNVVESGPEIIKTVTNETAAWDSYGISDRITWYLQPEIPKGIYSSLEYKVTDQLDEKLVLDKTSVKVYYKNPVTQSEVLLTETTHYDVSYDDVTKLMTVTLNETGRKELKKAHTEPFSIPLPKLYIKFETEFDKAVMDEDKIEEFLVSDIDNGGTIDYTNNSRKSYKKNSNRAKVHYGGVALKKIDGKQKFALSGAKFKIYTSEADAKADQNAIKNPITRVGEWVLESKGDGIVKFYGLKYGSIGNKVNEGSTDYWIVEVESPLDSDGKRYNLLDGPMKVTVNATSHQTAIAIEIENNKGFELPKTGGMGTFVFTAAGIALIAAAIIISRAAKKKNKE